jgi:hypothetical protein
LNISTAVTLTVLSDGTTPTNLVDDELIEVQCVFTWTGFNFTNEWVEFTIEDFEAGNRWVISSVLDQGNVAQNPLKPISGATKIDVTGTGTNILTCKALVDTNVVSANKVSMSFRVYSEDVAVYDYLLSYLKEAERAYSLRKLSDDTIWSGSCIRVRRDFDNAELDIGFSSNVLDETALLNHVTNSGANPTANGYIVTWYDQSGNNNHATQSTAASQPRIVKIGVVETDPQNGLPAAFFDGSNDYMTYAAANNSVPVCTLSVFNRATTGINTVVMARAANNEPIAPLINTGNQLRSFLGSAYVDHDTSFTATGDFLMLFSRDLADDNRMRVNGVEKTNATQSSLFPTRLWDSIGRRNGVYQNGYIQEAVLYLRDETGNFSTIETNVNNFYSLW